jgi:hypothetical protein
MSGQRSTPFTAATADGGRRQVRLVARALVTTAAAAALVSAASLSASAAPGDTSAATVVANVNVNSTINLSLNQGSFTINAPPDSTVSKTGAVTGVVTTNNASGYSIGVTAAGDTLQPTLQGNTNTIPIANLKVANAAGTFTSLSSNPLAPVVTKTKPTRSALGDVDTPAGDAFSNDYQITVPGVNSDSYHVTLNYTATALA